MEVRIEWVPRWVYFLQLMHWGPDIWPLIHGPVHCCIDGHETVCLDASLGSFDATRVPCIILKNIWVQLEGAPPRSCLREVNSHSASHSLLREMILALAIIYLSERSENLPCSSVSSSSALSCSLESCNHLVCSQCPIYCHTDSVTSVS